MNEFSDRDKDPELDAARERVKNAGGFALSGFAAQMQRDHDELKAKYGDDFEKPLPAAFGLNVAEAKCIDEWVESLRPEIMAKQGKKYEDISPDEPYYGAVGGGLTYCFTTTSLGTILVVKESITAKELNVSDALRWFFYG